MKLGISILMLNAASSQTETVYDECNNYQDCPTKSPYPGGYITLGLQFGKNNDGIKFRSYQINFGVGLTQAPQLFLGVTFGNRIFKNEPNYQYMDLQLSCLYISGVGIGVVRKNNKIYNRKKGWIGLGPVMYSKDWVFINKNPEINSGPMFALPVFIVFGNAFYPI